MAMTKAIGYARVSTAEQVDGFGLDVQRAAILTHCKAHRLRLVSLLADEGESGSNGLDTRKGLAEALAVIEAGNAEALVVYNYSRLARDVILQETIIRCLEGGGSQVLSIQEPEMSDADDPTRVLVRTVLGAIHEFDKAKIRGRMMAGKAVKISKGGYGGGRPAYGYKAAGGELVANEGESAVINAVTKLRRSGESYRAIALALSEAGITTRTGGPWNPNQVRRIAQRAGIV